MTGMQHLDSMLVALMKMRERLSDPDNWCQGDIQRNHQYCLIGTAKLVTGCPMKEWTDEAVHIDEFLGGLCGDPVSASNFNDTHSHADVLALLDCAIAAKATA